MTYCDSCLDSVSEEFGTDDMVSLGALLSIMGEDVPDHECDRINSGGELECACTGHGNRERKEPSLV